MKPIFTDFGRKLAVLVLFLALTLAAALWGGAPAQGEGGSCPTAYECGPG